MRTLGTNLQASVDERADNAIFLFSMVLPTTTIYRTTHNEDVTWNSQTWEAEVVKVKLGSVGNAGSMVARVSLSANQSENQFLAFGGPNVQGSVVTIYSTHILASYGTDDVKVDFKGKVDQVRDRKNGWLDFELIQSSSVTVLPPKRINKRTWSSKHIIKPGTYQMMGRVVTLEGDDV